MAHSQVHLAKPNRHTFCAPKPNGLRKALACCLLPAACCLLPAACCLLPDAHSSNAVRR